MNEKNNKVIKADEKNIQPNEICPSYEFVAGMRTKERVLKWKIYVAPKKCLPKKQFLFIPLTYERKTQIQMTFQHIFLSVARLFFAFIAGDAREY